MRAFGSNREGGARAHAGCDLYYPKDTPVYAVADGTVTGISDPFYCGTMAIEINHGDFVVRYGEVGWIDPRIKKVGAKVTVGQQIARVGILVGIKVPSYMLHLEMYSGTEKGPLTVYKGSATRKGDNVPFKRRKDLIDPTPYLNAWQKNLPKP
jgi:murein DD-endopeptidase MepM/ murein hydrolase activator NlpD